MTEEKPMAVLPERAELPSLREKPFVKVTAYKDRVHDIFRVAVDYFWPNAVEGWIQDKLHTIDSEGNRLYTNVTFNRHDGGMEVWSINSLAYYHETDDE